SVRHRHVTVASAPVHPAISDEGPMACGPGGLESSMSMIAALAIVVLFAMTGLAAGQEIRPTLDKLKETGVIHLGYRETSRPFSFVGGDGKPAGYSVDLCLQIVDALRKTPKLSELKVTWVAVTPADRIPKLVKGTIDLECGSTTITFGRME